MTLQLAEKLSVLKGHEFTRAISRTKSARPLGPEGRSLGDSLTFLLFPAASLVVPIKAGKSNAGFSPCHECKTQFPSFVTTSATLGNHPPNGLSRKKALDEAALNPRLKTQSAIYPISAPASPGIARHKPTAQYQPGVGERLGDFASIQKPRRRDARL